MQVARTPRPAQPRVPANGWAPSSRLSVACQRASVMPRPGACDGRTPTWQKEHPCQERQTCERIRPSGGVTRREPRPCGALNAGEVRPASPTNRRGPHADDTSPTLATSHWQEEERPPNGEVMHDG